jgi:hypothetical protein
LARKRYALVHLERFMAGFLAPDVRDGHFADGGLLSQHDLRSQIPLIVEVRQF